VNARLRPAGASWPCNRAGLSRAADGRVRICDSLIEQPYEEDQANYLRDRVYSLILIESETP
jgi:hypothetical protein